MTFGDSRDALLSTLLTIVGIAAAGCGGGDGDSADAESNGLSSEPAKLIEKILHTTAAAKKPADCKEVATINLRSQTKSICPPLDAQGRQASRTTKLTRAATYGTSAVIDYKSKGAPKGASILLYRNSEGQWTIGRWGLLYGETVGTDDADAHERSAKVVDRYLTAVRDRDCKSFLKYAAARSEDPKVACKQEFAAMKPLADALRANPTARPAYVDGNEAFGFYRLDLNRPKPVSYTISTTKTADGALRPHVVLDSVLGPTAGS
jgi:hypothetical protein